MTRNAPLPAGSPRPAGPVAPAWAGRRPARPGLSRDARPGCRTRARALRDHAGAAALRRPGGPHPRPRARPPIVKGSDPLTSRGVRAFYEAFWADAPRDPAPWAWEPRRALLLAEA